MYSFILKVTHINWFEKIDSDTREHIAVKDNNKIVDFASFKY